MPEITIDVSELHGENADKVKDLVDLLKSKVDERFETVGSEVVLSYKEDEKPPAKKYLRVLIRRFLHKAELKEDFRVISGKESEFTIKEKRVFEAE
jgi:hypothetical protein